MCFRFKKQKAGNDSTQNQIENQDNYNVSIVHNYYGIQPTKDATMATTVYNQIIPQTLKEYAEIAMVTVNERLNSFGHELFPRIEKIEGAMEAFKDPKLQFLLKDAQITAAKTDRTEDLILLTELLTCHIAKGGDRKIDAGIHHAIKSVDEIDNDALCALTVAYAFQFYSPVTDTISDGLKLLDDLFGKLIYMKLPDGVRWLDHMDMLGALRLSSLNKSNSIEYLCSRYNVRQGIKQDSEELERAYTILDDNGFPHSYLMNNECVDGYLVFKGTSFDDIDFFINDNVKKQILGLYCKEKNILKSAKEKFIELWDSYPNLKIARNWWDQIPNWYRITYMGRVLAQTNAKRINPELPDFI